MSKLEDFVAGAGSSGLRTRIDRKQRLLTYLLRKLLRWHPYDFRTYGQMAAIVGDGISDQIRMFGRYEDEPLRYLAAKVFNDDKMINHVCLDVGANIGNHAILFRRYFRQVIAFEPNPVARQLLELNLTMNEVRNVQVVPVGLSNRAGTEKLSVCVDNLGASRLARLKENEPSGEFQFGQDVEIQLAIGDSLVEATERVGFIKVDVEGMELEVLEGLSETIRLNGPLIMLEQLSSAIDPASGESSVSEFMRNFGYRAYEIRRVTRSKNEFVHNIRTFISGDIRYSLVPVDAFEKRDYPVLILAAEDVTTAKGTPSFRVN